MKKLSLVNQSKENSLSNKDLKKLRGGYVQPGACCCGCERQTLMTAIFDTVKTSQKMMD